MEAARVQLSELYLQLGKSLLQGVDRHAAALARSSAVLDSDVTGFDELQFVRYPFEEDSIEHAISLVQRAKQCWSRVKHAPTHIAPLWQFASTQLLRIATFTSAAGWFDDVEEEVDTLEVLVNRLVTMIETISSKSQTAVVSVQFADEVTGLCNSIKHNDISIFGTRTTYQDYITDGVMLWKGLVLAVIDAANIAFVVVVADGQADRAVDGINMVQFQLQRDIALDADNAFIAWSEMRIPAYRLFCKAIEVGNDAVKLLRTSAVEEAYRKQNVERVVNFYQSLARTLTGSYEYEVFSETSSCG